MDEIVCVSIIVPCFNEGEALPAFIRELNRVFQELTTIQKEVIFINDGSNDLTLTEMKELAATYLFVH